MERGCQKPCMPKCHRKCIGEFTEKYRVYETCYREIVKVCPRCGCEYTYMHPMHSGYGGMHMSYPGEMHMGMMPRQEMYMGHHYGVHMMSDEM